MLSQFQKALLESDLVEMGHLFIAANNEGNLPGAFCLKAWVTQGSVPASEPPASEKDWMRQALFLPSRAC